MTDTDRTYRPVPTLAERINASATTAAILGRHDDADSTTAQLRAELARLQSAICLISDAQELIDRAMAAVNTTTGPGATTADDVLEKAETARVDEYGLLWRVAPDGQWTNAIIGTISEQVLDTRRPMSVLLIGLDEDDAAAAPVPAPAHAGDNLAARADRVAQAIGDPGSITARRETETVTRWSTRAVLIVLAEPTATP